jgi:hypothetical protein
LDKGSSSKELLQLFIWHIPKQELGIEISKVKELTRIPYIPGLIVKVRLQLSSAVQQNSNTNI